MVNKMSEFLLGSFGLTGFLYVSVGDKETDQMIGGYGKLVDVLQKNRKQQFRWVAYGTPYAIHQDNALISTSKGLAELEEVFERLQNKRILRQRTRHPTTHAAEAAKQVSYRALSVPRGPADA